MDELKRRNFDELMDRLARLRNEVRDIEDQLRQIGVDDPSLIDDERLEAIAHAAREIVLEQFQFALARVDFRDEFYRFIRAIDGDTVVVAPPASLRGWMKDIHVRLYGLEVPELWEEGGDEYREHLELLCAQDAGRRLMIIWERERPNTNYGGFPLASFERGIGHVFFREVGGDFIYVNGLMQLLKDSTLERKGKSLLRGRRVIKNLDIKLDQTWRCPNWPAIPDGASATYRQVVAPGPPACALRFETLPTLDPRHANFAHTAAAAFMDSRPESCRLRHDLRDWLKRLSSHVENQSASPFDVPLLFASLWASAEQ